MTPRIRLITILIFAALLFIAVLIMTTHRADAAPACIYEDGSSQGRCIWDSKHMGYYSKGDKVKSVIIKHGGTRRAEYIPISHKKAHRMLAKSGYFSH